MKISKLYFKFKLFTHKYDTFNKQNFFVNSNSSLVDNSNEDLVAISIEDTEKPKANEQNAKDEKSSEVLLPVKTTLGEPNCYEWKEITQEFFEAVKGLFLTNFIYILRRMYE